MLPEQVLRLLLANCEVEEECRNVVAECMGHLALLFPAEVLPALQQRQMDPSPSVRAAIVTAVKYAVVPQPHPIDALLQSSIVPFLRLVSDPDRCVLASRLICSARCWTVSALCASIISAAAPMCADAHGVPRSIVRKAAVQMLSSAAHSKAALVAEHLPAVMPRLYAQTVINAALIRTVDLGPFKHKIDDGLELRKAAFECMDVLLDTCCDRLDIPAFISHLESGLKVC